MSIKVRPGLLFDIDVIADFQVKMALETENLKLDPPTVVKGVTAVFDDPAKGKYWVAEDQGEVIACVLTTPEWSDWRNGTVWWIMSLYVRPEYRQKGVFKQLYEHLKKIVEETPDLRGFRLFVDKSNERAQKVYKAIGMVNEHYDIFEWMK